MDPCLFVFTDPKGNKAWAMIHTDDVDAVGETDEILENIFKTIDEIWSLKACDADYMLGISRTI
jgi:hypothetical protein